MRHSLDKERCQPSHLQIFPALKESEDFCAEHSGTLRNQLRAVLLRAGVESSIAK